MATRFARQGGTGGGNVSAGRLAGAYVGAHGGAAGAVAGAVAGRRTAGQLGGFLATVAHAGLPAALEELGLANLVGRDATDVLLALVDRLAGPNNTLEESAARAALVALLEELFGDTDTFADLSGAFTRQVDKDGVWQLLERFLVEYIYHRMLEEIGDRLENGSVSPVEARKVEQDIHAFIQEDVKLEFTFSSPTEIEWTGREGQEVVERLLTNAYGQLREEEV